MLNGCVWLGSVLRSTTWPYAVGDTATTRSALPATQMHEFQLVRLASELGQKDCLSHTAESVDDPRPGVLTSVSRFAQDATEPLDQFVATGELWKWVLGSELG